MKNVPAIGYTLRLIGFTLGASLNAFLLAILVRKRRAALGESVVAAVLSFLGLWHGVNAVVMFRRLNADAEGSGTLLTAVLSPLWVVIALVVAAPVCLYIATRHGRAQERRFFFLFAATALAFPVTVAVAGQGATALVLVSLAPPVAFAWFVYNYNLLNLLISRRIVFALKLGAFFAIYLFLIREISLYVEEAYGAHGPLLEIVLVFAAGLIWLPLYGWMTRSLSRRTQLYAGFSKRLIEEAARILDLRGRLQFIADELRRTFGLRRVLLAASGDPAIPAEVEALVREQRIELACVSRSPDSRIGRLIGDLGFNYLFPLWYEQHLAGCLFVDTSPRMLLDENEDILLGVSRQISSSIETCRLIEEQIRLGRALADQEHMASLGRVAATIAHEIKNPLSSIKALTQLMREDPEVHVKHDRDLAYIIDEADRLNRSVQQLLSFSRPLSAQRQEVDLSRLLGDLGESLARQHAGGGIRVTHRVQPGLWLNRSDPEMVRQVVLNLLLNAVQASVAGGEVRMEAGASQHRDICISVSDDGPGIPADIRGRIFEPFFTTKQRGTGLGLAIVQKNVLHLGGKVEVNSPVREERGTRIQVTLPAE